MLPPLCPPSCDGTIGSPPGASTAATDGWSGAGTPALLTSRFQVLDLGEGLGERGAWSKMSPEEKIDALRLRIAQRSGENDVMIEFLAVTNIDGCFSLSFYGRPYDTSCIDLMATLSDPEIAERIRYLALASPDIGANGTNDWDIAPLLGGSAIFSAMETFVIRLNQPGDHNGIIVSSHATHEEDGVIARLVERSPHLKHLTMPSAPDASFFAVKNNCIEYLNIDAGFDTQNFIHNLARFHSLPCLRSLEWGEFNAPYMENWRQYVTPVEDYKALFRSPQFDTVKSFVWRNPACSDAEIKEIALPRRHNLQLLIVKYSARYLRWNHVANEWSEI
jgi:hypothetical protein